MPIVSRRHFAFYLTCFAATLMSMKPNAAAQTLLPKEAVDVWQNFLSSRGLKTGSISIPELVKSALDFYISVDATELALGPDSDMLLFQFGTYDFGQGDWFEFDITRQFITSANWEHDSISQLRCTAYFAPTEALRSIKAGNKWCKTKSEINKFRQFILGSTAYQAVVFTKPHHVKTIWGLVD